MISKKTVGAMKWPTEEETVQETAPFHHAHRPIDRELLDEELTKENCKDKFHQRLCHEEEYEKILKERYLNT